MMQLARRVFTLQDGAVARVPALRVQRPHARVLPRRPPRQDG